MGLHIKNFKYAVLFLGEDKDMFKKFLIIATTINLLFQIVYSIFGANDNLLFLFVVFHPIYLLISGIVSLGVILLSAIKLLTTIWKRQKDDSIFILIILVMNLEYLYFWIKLMMIQ